MIAWVESLFRWITRASGPAPRVSDAAWQLARTHVPMTRRLTPADDQRLRALTEAFLRKKRVIAAGGLELTAEMRLVIAVQACLPILELGLAAYRDMSTVIVYPAAFAPEHERTDDHGIVHAGAMAQAGEAWERGPVILSWEDAEQGIAWPEDGVNVVIHEFAHKIDMLDGDANGIPPLHQNMDPDAWKRAFTTAYDHLCARVDDGLFTPIDPYAAESPAEFFAVLSEVFFERPDVLRGEYPEVYGQLAAFYRQDTAGR